MNRARWAVRGHKPIVQAADSIGRSLAVKASAGSREGASKDSSQDAQEHDGRICSQGNFPRDGFADYRERKNADDAEGAQNGNDIRERTPLVIAMYAMATSNAIGTGKNALTSAPE
jgi:hypothetical protein